MKLTRTPLSLALFAGGALACGDCSAPHNEVVQTRLVRRMQPDAQNATSGPKAPLEWGQVNFIQTTDTHGWLEGHIKERNYGADWGDFVSFTAHMKQKAKSLGVDLLLIDTGVSFEDGCYRSGVLIHHRISTMERVSAMLLHQMAWYQTPSSRTLTMICSPSETTSCTSPRLHMRPLASSQKCMVIDMLHPTSRF